MSTLDTSPLSQIFVEVTRLSLSSIPCTYQPFGDVLSVYDKISTGRPGGQGCYRNCLDA